MIKPVLNSNVIPRITRTIVRESATSVLPGVAIYSMTGSMLTAVGTALGTKLVADFNGANLFERGVIKNVSDFNLVYGKSVLRLRDKIAASKLVAIVNGIATRFV